MCVHPAPACGADGGLCGCLGGGSEGGGRTARAAHDQLRQARARVRACVQSLRTGVPGSQLPARTGAWVIVLSVAGCRRRRAMSTRTLACAAMLSQQPCSQSYPQQPPCKVHVQHAWLPAIGAGAGLQRRRRLCRLRSGPCGRGARTQARACVRSCVCLCAFVCVLVCASGWPRHLQGS